MKKPKLHEKMNKECWLLKCDGGEIACNSKRMMHHATDAIQQEKLFCMIHAIAESG